MAKAKIPSTFWFEPDCDGNTNDFASKHGGRVTIPEPELLSVLAHVGGWVVAVWSIQHLAFAIDLEDARRLEHFAGHSRRGLRAKFAGSYSTIVFGPVSTHSRWPWAEAGAISTHCCEKIACENFNIRACSQENSSIVNGTSSAHRIGFDTQAVSLRLRLLPAGTICAKLEDDHVDNQTCPDRGGGRGDACCSADCRRLQHAPPDDALSLDRMARPAPKQSDGKSSSEAVPSLAGMEKNASGQSALFSLLGHKGDLMFVHFRESFDDLNQRRTAAGTASAQRILGAHDLLSVGHRTRPLRIHAPRSTRLSPSAASSRIRKSGNAKFSDTWPARKKPCGRASSRRFRPTATPVSIPWTAAAAKTRTGTRCPSKNAQRQMDEHGLVGRRYAGEVRQIITGSIGFDDWEWGVDLFADDPLVFKKLIYEMRFDHVSAVYALFGQFYVGLRCPAEQIGTLLEGELPVGVESQRRCAHSRHPR